MSESSCFFSKYKGYIYIILGVFTWSFSEITVKLTQSTVGPYALSFFRFFIGGLFLFVILCFKKDIGGTKSIISNNFLLFVISSFIGLGISNVIYYVGISQTQANIGSAIYTSYPIYISIYSIFLLNERSNLKLKAIGYVLGFIGVIILVTEFNFQGLVSVEYLIGNLMVLLGSVIWSVFSVLSKKIMIKEEETSNVNLKVNMLSFLFAAIPTFVILLFTDEFSYFLQYDLASWFIIFFLGIVSTALGLYIFFVGIENIEMSKGISLAYLKPVFTTILAFFILSELPTMALFLSIPIIFLSIYLINRKND